MRQLTICILVVLSLAYRTSHAADPGTQPWYQDRFVFTPSVGMLSNSAGEYVYDDRYKLSQLDWRARNVPVIKLQIDYLYSPALRFHAKMWSTMKEHNGTMNDYDWLNPRQSSWTHWSSHNKSPLHHAFEADIGYTIVLLETEQLKGEVLMGYQFNRFRWSAYGGQINYDNGRDIRQTSDAILGITYSQKFSTLYVGSAARYTYSKWSLGGLIKLGFDVTVEDEDEHLLRNINFKGKMKGMLVATELSLDYAITPQFTVTTNYTYSFLTSDRGTTEILDRNTGQLKTNADSAAMSNDSRMLTVGLRYAF